MKKYEQKDLIIYILINSQDFKKNAEKYFKNIKIIYIEIRDEIGTNKYIFPAIIKERINKSVNILSFKTKNNFIFYLKESSDIHNIYGIFPDNIFFMKDATISNMIDYINCNSQIDFYYVYTIGKSLESYLHRICGDISQRAISNWHNGNFFWEYSNKDLSPDDIYLPAITHKNNMSNLLFPDFIMNGFNNDINCVFWKGFFPQSITKQCHVGDSLIGVIFDKPTYDLNIDYKFKDVKLIEPREPNQDLVFLINTTYKYFKSTLPYCLNSMFLNNISKDNIKIIVSNSPKEYKSVYYGVDIYYVSDNSYDHTAFIWALEVNYPAKWFFMLHDTCIVGLDFYKKIKELGFKSHCTCGIDGGWCLFGLFSQQYLFKNQQYLLKLKNITKQRTIFSENPYIYMDDNYIAFQDFIANIDNLMSYDYDVFGLGPKRIPLSISNIDLIKYQGTHVDSQTFNNVMIEGKLE